MTASQSMTLAMFVPQLQTNTPILRSSIPLSSQAACGAPTASRSLLTIASAFRSAKYIASGR